MKVTEWFAAGRRQRHADLDARVLAELRRLGGEADALTIRGTVRTQLAVVQASLKRLEEAGQVGSRVEGQAAKTYFTTDRT